MFVLPIKFIIHQVASFAIACSSDEGKAREIRSLLASLEWLQTWLVPTLLDTAPLVGKLGGNDSKKVGGNDVKCSSGDKEVGTMKEKVDSEDKKASIDSKEVVTMNEKVEVIYVKSSSGFKEVGNKNKKASIDNKKVDAKKEKVKNTKSSKCERVLQEEQTSSLLATELRRILLRHWDETVLGLKDTLYAMVDPSALTLVRF